MLYFIAPYLEKYWGPFRLLRSHALLLAAGTLLAALAVVLLLPKLCRFSPHDHGKAILGSDGMVSKGKPTGTGLWVTLLLLPIVLMVMPLSLPSLGMLICLYVAMVFGYLDDRSDKPWGQLKKGLLDMTVCLGVSFFVWLALKGPDQCVEVWLPSAMNVVWRIPWWAYIPSMGFLLFVTMNATNCSDGVDGLAGSLSVISLVSLAAFLYVVIGNNRMAAYLGVPHNYLAVRWAILLMTVAG